VQKAMKYLIEYLHSYAMEISVNVMYVPIRERQLNIISVQHKNLRILFNKDIT
jgi:hypothetical protein